MESLGEILSSLSLLFAEMVTLDRGRRSEVRKMQLGYKSVLWQQLPWHEVKERAV